MDKIFDTAKDPVLVHMQKRDHATVIVRDVQVLIFLSCDQKPVSFLMSRTENSQVLATITKIEVFEPRGQ